MGAPKDNLIDIFYPRGIKCIVCDGELDSDTRYGLCDKCKLTPNDVFCAVCGRPIPAQNTVCDRCYNTTYSFDGARSCFVFEDEAATLVRKLKYYDARYLAPVMAEFMADTYTEWGITADVATFVPLHRSRLRSRGYNQSELLARAMCDKVGLKCEALLVKTKKTANMARLGREARISLIADSFSVSDCDVRRKTILLIDDTLTTGSTANECARMLKLAGCTSVYVLTFTSSKPRKFNI